MGSAKSVHMAQSSTDRHATKDKVTHSAGTHTATSTGSHVCACLDIGCWQVVVSHVHLTTNGMESVVHRGQALPWLWQTRPNTLLQYLLNSNDCAYF